MLVRGRIWCPGFQGPGESYIDVSSPMLPSSFGRLCVEVVVLPVVAERCLQSYTISSCHHQVQPGASSSSCPCIGYLEFEVITEPEHSIHQCRAGDAM